MHSGEFVETILRGEDSFSQFKENIFEARKLAEELVAFSNAEGGTIIVGVNDSGDF